MLFINIVFNIFIIIIVTSKLYLNAQNEASFLAQVQVNFNVYQDENNELQKLSNNVHIVINELNNYKISLNELAKNEKEDIINIISQSINENYKYCRDSVVDCNTNGKIGLKQFKQGKICTSYDYLYILYCLIFD